MTEIIPHTYFETDDFVVLAEPGHTIFSLTWSLAPKGTPIWAGFTAGMTGKEIRERFPFLNEWPDGTLSGQSKLFGSEADLICHFDDRLGLEMISASIFFEEDDVDGAALKLNDLVHLWESELFPADRVWFSSTQAIIKKGSLHVRMDLCLDMVTPCINVYLQAVDEEKPDLLRSEVMPGQTVAGDGGADLVPCYPKLGSCLTVHRTEH